MEVLCWLNFSIVTYFRVKRGLILVYLIVILNITFMANKIIEVHSKSGQCINYTWLAFHCVECKQRVWKNDDVMWLIINSVWIWTLLNCLILQSLEYMWYFRMSDQFNLEMKIIANELIINDCSNARWSSF